MTTPAPPPPNVRQIVPLLNVTDLERSLRFYTEGLGFTLTNKWIPDGRLRWCSLRLGQAEIMLQQSWRNGQPAGAPAVPLGQGVAFCFVCADALSIYHDLKSRNVPVARPFVGNHMWVASVRDPDGYHIDFESPTGAAEETVFDG